MRKTVRYCIQCGREIGDARHCTNPECGGIPNFYRDVPGPGRGKKGKGEREGARRAAATSAETGVPPEGGSESQRSTVPLRAAPVALLRAVSAPHEEHLLHAGKTEIGALPPAQIIIDRPEISSRHASLECRSREDGSWQFTIADHDSTNGTFVNGERVKNEELAIGDRLRFADVEFRLLLVEEDHPRVTMKLPS
jgi:hypothetical protein